MRILCVERDRAKLRQMRRETRELVPGARIILCRDPGKAVELAEEHGCDVLITGIDIGESGREGISLAEKIKQRNPCVNIIFITVRSMQDCANDFVRLRASGYIRKPYEARELAEEFANLRYAI